MSVFIIGTCIGFRTKEQIDKSTGAVTRSLLLGISVPKENGFDGETDVTSIKIKEDMQDQKLLDLYLSLKGKAIMVPVRPFAYSMRGDSAGIAWSLAGDGKPSLAPTAKAPAAATS